MQSYNPFIEDCEVRSRVKMAPACCRVQLKSRQAGLLGYRKERHCKTCVKMSRLRFAFRAGSNALNFMGHRRTRPSWFFNEVEARRFRLGGSIAGMPRVFPLQPTDSFVVALHWRICCITSVFCCIVYMCIVFGVCLFGPSNLGLFEIIFLRKCA